jgi:hypothetical protein
MEMLTLFGVLVLVAVIAGIFGWQQGRSAYNYTPQIEPPGPEGIPTRIPDLTGNEPYCCR